MNAKISASFSYVTDMNVGELLAALLIEPRIGVIQPSVYFSIHGDGADRLREEGEGF